MRLYCNTAYKYLKRGCVKRLLNKANIGILMIISIMDSCMKLETLSEEFAPKVFSDRSLL